MYDQDEDILLAKIFQRDELSAHSCFLANPRTKSYVAWKERSIRTKYVQKIATSFFLAFSDLSKLHRIMLGLLTVLTLAAAVWRPHGYHRSAFSVIKTTESEKRKLHLLLSKTSTLINKMLQDNQAILGDQLDKEKINKVSTYTHLVTAGDTLSNVLKQHGIEISDIYQLTMADRQLRNLKIGQKLFWTLTNDGTLQCFIWKISGKEIRIYNRTKNAFKIDKNMKKDNRTHEVLRFTVGANFISSAYKAGLTSNEISEVMKEMQWKINFRKLKREDKFSILISYKMLAGQRVQSQLLGVRFYSEGKNYYIIRAEDGKFYDRHGTGFGKNFLRFPTSRQFRVSSHFNPRRLNPITGRLAPHRGVDFVMPQGTPVLAAGDGEVMVAKHNGAAGCYIAVRHGPSYTTRYMHLRKILVKSGQKVIRGERIALSGNTGRSTGPHLHYEVWVNHQAVNPLTVKLPFFSGELIGKDRAGYLSQVKEVIQKLHFN